MVRPGAVTRRSPFAWAVAEPLAAKNADFFGCFFRTGMFKMGQTFWGSIKQPSGGSQSRTGFWSFANRFSPGIQVDGSHEWRSLVFGSQPLVFHKVMVVIPRVSLVLYYPRNLWLARNCSWWTKIQQQPPGMYKTRRKEWDTFTISTGARRISEPSTVSLCWETI